MKHQLILFYGSSSGYGKSTLSSCLLQVLKQNELPVEWIYEDDVLHLELFEPVMAFMRGESELDFPEACLATTERLVDRYADSGITVLADSILPYYDWLLAANIGISGLETFSQTLWQLLQPMNPLIVYLQGDVEIAIKRAVAYRGQAWLDGNIDFMNTWRANQVQPITDLTDVITYLQRTDRDKVQLLSEWVGDVLWLDSTTHSADVCAATLLQHLGLPAAECPRQLCLESFKRYIGRYIAYDDSQPKQQKVLTITLRDGDLWVDHYWPNGCRLTAETEQTFRLEDTSHWIEFVEPAAANARQLLYHYGGNMHMYECLNQHVQAAKS